ncbi:hypothetical protein [Microbacterium sp. Root166]|uniref:hypothetical protein n=1 Tax=Microbacterium sp. Root166 TaxID=1736478 RepID=UPI000AAD77CD|nr:hypothetical protein [Microbacterium sp. Root166]
MTRSALRRPALLAIAVIGTIAIVIGVIVIAFTSGQARPVPVASSAATATRVLIEPDEALDDRWQAIALQFPDAQRPTANELHRYQAGEFPYDRAACLANARAGGFDPTGFGITERTSNDLNARLEAYVCAVWFPITGVATAVAPLSESELSRLHAGLVDYRACIVQSGEPATPLIAQADFERHWPAIGELPQPTPGITQASDWQASSRVCAEPDPRP